MPRLFLRLTAKVCPLGSAEFVFIKSHWGQEDIVDVSLVDFNGPLEEVFQNDLKNKDSPSLYSISQLRMFDYRYFRFIFNPIEGKFQTINKWKDSKWTSVDNLLKGISDEETLSFRRKIFGKNALEIKAKSDFDLFVEEVLHPFFIFQIASIVLWSLDDYYWYATCIFCVSIGSMIFTLVETKQSIQRMKEMSRFTCQVKVFRSAVWQMLSNEDLIPGDLVELSNSTKIIPCDAIILDGSCIVNESMLTGESIPISKSPVTDEDLEEFDIGIDDPTNSYMTRFFLHNGTKVIRIRHGTRHDAVPSGYHPDSELDFRANRLTEPGALVMVVRCGFNTTKGTLIRSMLFPRPNNFEFYKDSFRFIGVLSMIAGIGFIFASWQFILNGVHLKTVIIRALDLVTIVVPPALPATLLIGTSFAIERLRLKDIFCVSPQRVNICGTLNVLCFDKTGTLTQEGLDVLGVRKSDPNYVYSDSNDYSGSETKNFVFSTLYNSMEEFQLLQTQHDSPQLVQNSISAYPLIICGMAICHSIKVVDSELIGDPLDIKMFEFTKWSIEEGGSRSDSTTTRKSSSVTAGGLVNLIVRPPESLEGPSSESKLFTEIGVIRQFDFLSHLRRMGVIVKRLDLTKDLETGSTYQSRDMEVFVKGAPEVIKSICLPETSKELIFVLCTFYNLEKNLVPGDFDILLARYAKNGHRVIALAWRVLENIPWIRAIRMKREDVERDLVFLGFVIFENKLKENSPSVVKLLDNANITPMMCTGDNIFTAISVSRDCGIVSPKAKIFVGRLLKAEESDQAAEVLWEDTDDGRWILDPPHLVESEIETESSENLLSPSLEFSLESPTSTHLVRITEPLKENQIFEPVEYYLSMTGDVFHHLLEFTPVEILKKALIKGRIYARMSPEQKQQLIERLQELGYCVGFCGDGANDCGALRASDVGLSLSEAEASVAAPFTSRQTELDCVPILIREGRAALVTSFACFQFMAMYSMIQFTSVSILYYIGSNLGDLQFLYIDLAIIVPVASCMGYSKAHKKVYQKPPTAKLVSRGVLTSLITQVIIQMSFQLGSVIWIQRQEWYKKPDTDVERKRFNCMENSVVFLVSCFQYLIVALVVSTGSPHRESIWANSTPLRFDDLSFNFDKFHAGLSFIPIEGRIAIVAFIATNFLTSILMNWLFVPTFAKLVGRWELLLLALQAPETKTYLIPWFMRNSVSQDPERQPLLQDGQGRKETQGRIMEWAKREKWRHKRKFYKVLISEMND
ncbi:hypothetical protein HK096_002457 [Nowakowskiella sp. JEL0078]|nr:hypothetical protein HK096_002457 [Nowakowskiella sp. JEL0078]